MEVVNRIANSPLVTFKLEELAPQGERVPIDIKEILFQGMILREKDLREWVKTHDWAQYEGKHVAVFCSAEAIVQTWAYMLLAAKLQPYAATVVFGSLEELEKTLWLRQLDQVDWASFADRPVVVKGCSDIKVPTTVYVETANRLLPHVKKLSWGEPCSTVPLYKKK
jgi:hypothetical protein